MPGIAHYARISTRPRVAAPADGERLRLVIRRTRLTEEAHQQLWPDWRHCAFITDRDDLDTAAAEFHRAHATVELAIRDPEENAGLQHLPSGSFNANAAWLTCADLAHNLLRYYSKA
ncbi:MAG: hypothetical protein OXG52_05475 [bacterium]|nr:hypothetical protein [bacterium]